MARPGTVIAVFISAYHHDGSARMKHLIFSQMQTFRGLFTSICLIFTLAAFFEGLGFADEILFGILTLLMLSAVGAVNDRHGQKFFIVSAAITIAMNMAAYLTPYLNLDILSLTLNLLILGYASWLIFLKVFSATQIDSDLIYGAICIYLFLGIDCAIAYDVIGLLDAHAFAIQQDVKDQSLAPAIETFMHTYLYFSFSTLTSVGYGDIVPVSSLARYTAILQAVAGQIYLSVLVARLVGLHITARH